MPDPAKPPVEPEAPETVEPSSENPQGQVEPAPQTDKPARVEPRAAIPADSPEEPIEPDDTDQIRALESKLAEARKDARKKREQRSQTLQEFGRYQELYEEKEEEATTLQREVDTLQPQVDTLTTERDRYKKELDGYRTTLVEMFTEGDDRSLAEETSLTKLPALYERLYQRPLMQTKPGPSPGVHSPASRAAPQAPQTLADVNRALYSK